MNAKQYREQRDAWKRRADRAETTLDDIKVRLTGMGSSLVEDVQTMIRRWEAGSFENCLECGVVHGTFGCVDKEENPDPHPDIQAEALAHEVLTRG